MRPRRRAAAAAAAVKIASPSPDPSEEYEMDSSDVEEMDTNRNELAFSEDDEIDEEEGNMQDNDINMNSDGSLSEQEEEDEDQENVQQDDEEEEDEDEEEEEVFITRKAPTRNNKRKKPAIEQESDEEEFSENDEEVLRNRPMTKRQRAKVYQEIPEELLELPLDTGKKRQLTEEEEQLKKSEVARRRKNQSIQRAEKDKADTINRLLKKQASKSKKIIDETEEKETAHEKLLRLEDPHRIRYISSEKANQLCIPSVFTIEQVFGEINHVSLPKKHKNCEVKGCSKSRKYTVKSGKSVCSLEHYKLIEAKQ